MGIDDAFTSSSAQPQHMDDVEDPYDCELCNKSFDSEEELKEHVYAVHELEQEDA